MFNYSTPVEKPYWEKAVQKRILLQQANFDSPLAFRYQLIYQGYTV